MGNRVKGRVKKKSIKAATHSKMGSKRKLSRMGKKQKKDHAGLEATFIGRSKCLKMLQVTIKDFRRLCILKGIYPREPRGRTPGNKKGQTFYHIKDIRAIAHEPILEKFRGFRAFVKKIRRASGRNEKDEANRKNAICPTYTLHHLVRERYPRFSDALSDLDDALTLVFLFAALPSEHAIKPRITNKSKSLAAAWGAYCATTGCITKSFISVKGIYLEAQIKGIPIRWIVPHAFTQFMPEDVDYRVMTTFFEFYETLLHFVLFKLCNDIGVRYPLPAVDAGGEVKGSTSFILGANLRDLKNALSSKSNGAIVNVVSESIQQEDNKSPARKKKTKSEKKKSKELLSTVETALKNMNESDDDDDDDDDDSDTDNNGEISGALEAALKSMEDDQSNAMLVGDKLDDEALKRRRLFAGLTFFLSREVPLGYLELVCLAYGAKVGWEGPNSPIPENDPSITHHIVDRPKLPASYESLPKSREFVQPQWVLDCANFMFVLPIAKYAVGTALPPHLSPWVDAEEEGYKPAYLEEIERLKNGEVLATDDVDGNDAMVEGSNEVSDSESDKKEKSDDSESEDDKEKDESEDEEEEEEEEEEDDEVAEKKSKTKRQKEDEEARALAKTMMSRKASHLYGRMQHGIAKKKARVEQLTNRRKTIEISKEKAKSMGKTTSKQKVERLKKLRKDIENDYTNTGGSMKKSKKSRK